MKEISASKVSFFSRRWREIAVCAALALVVFLVYFPSLRFGFVNYDDPEYVTDNPYLKQGFSSEGLSWAFQSTRSGNWLPVTWLSYFLDYRLFGSNAAGYHLTNLLLHIGSTVLLFLVLRAMTGAFWRSLITTILFALHPLRVESVVWISERKDVLCAFFWMLTLWFYVQFARSRENGLKLTGRGKLHYVFAVICFLLGFMSKPMMVTLPFVLLLIDFWPLQRTSLSPRDLAMRGLEKLPFFLVSLVLIPLTVWAQSHANAMASQERFPVSERLANAVVSYLRYAGKTLWPVDLAVFYPRPHAWPVALLALAALFLVGGCLVSFWQRNTRPFIFSGWFWFVGTLVPVIGILQVGSQAMADRFAYLPVIGLVMAVVWGVGEFVRTPWARKLAAGLVVGMTAVGTVLTVKQIQYWENSEVLFKHALAVTEKNVIAYLNLGAAMMKKGDTNQAKAAFSSVLEIEPDNSPAHGNLAGIYFSGGDMEKAQEHYELAIRFGPRSAPLQNAYGFFLARQGKFEEAISHYETALEIFPDWPQALCNMGSALASISREDEAIARYQEALKIDPGYIEANYNLGYVLLGQKKYAEAERFLSVALKLNPDFQIAREELSKALLAMGRVDEAEKHLSAILARDSRNDSMQSLMAQVLASRGDDVGAVAHYRLALAARPDFLEALNNLSWILATSSNPQARDGAEAIRWGEKACDLTRRKQAVFIGTLAAAYAENGQFDKAVQTAEEAHQVAEASGETGVARRNSELMEIYRAGRPFREISNPKPESKSQ